MSVRFRKIQEDRIFSDYHSWFLGITVSMSNPLFLYLWINGYGAEKLKSVFCDVSFKGGNNAMHFLAKYGTLNSIDQCIYTLGQECSSSLAVVVNNEGSLPKNFLSNNNNLNSRLNSYLKADELFFKITKNPPTTQLSALINLEKLDQILKDNQCTLADDSTKARYIKVGVEAVNHVRKLVSYSETHRKININYELESMIRLAEVYYEGSGENCGVMAQKVNDFLKALNIPVENLVIENGDHAFNVLGRKKGSNPNNPADWGPDAVIVDAWAGDVYSVLSIDHHLKDYASVVHRDKVSYFLGAYNPKFHKLALSSIESPSCIGVVGENRPHV